MEIVSVLDTDFGGKQRSGRDLRWLVCIGADHSHFEDLDRLQTVSIGCDDFQGVSTKRLGSPREQAGIGIDFQIDPYGGGSVSKPEANGIGDSDGRDMT